MSKHSGHSGQERYPKAT